MNNTKHTPGPLHNVTGNRPGPWIMQVLNDESEAYIHDKHCNAIARVYSLSDAALIAAAPAMYIELKALYEYCLHNIPDMSEYSGDPEQAMRMKAARAALAQAEGRQG